MTEVKRISYDKYDLRVVKKNKPPDSRLVGYIYCIQIRQGRRHFRDFFHTNRLDNALQMLENKKELENLIISYEAAQQAVSYLR